MTGQQTPTDERRNSTAAKIVIGRDEIDQFGDSNLADVLKRLPSVTIGGPPGRGGQVRMRGMGSGYTQILIDGQRMPPGFAIDQLSPDQVERIEIYRAPTAETGARAIAGTINIILREPLRQQNDDVRAQVAQERGRLQENLSWSRNDVLGADGTYNLTLSLNHVDQLTDTHSQTTYSDLASGAPVLLQSGTSEQKEKRNSLFFTSRLQWRLGAGEFFSLQPFMVLARGHTQGFGTLDQTLGAMPQPYASSQSAGASRTAIGRLMAQLQKRLGESTRVELKAQIGAFNSNNAGLLNQFDGNNQPGLTQSTDTTINDRSWSTSGKLSYLLGGNHSLVAGLEAEGTRRTEAANTLVNGVPVLVDFGSDVSASTRRWALYAQDEWDPAPKWSAYAGLRWESIQTRSDSASASVQNTSRVLTPLAHAVWRFDDPKRDQVRFSLTKSYRAPTLQNLVSLPSLSSLYPVPGANTASSPDRAGNPALRPELANGIDIALEHYLPAGGLMSISVFNRDIKDLIRSVTSLETVSWASSQRWVSRPQNIGDAVSQGIELEAKFKLDELMADAIPLSIRANLSFYRSRVSGIPGPDNRIDQQPGVTGNLGMDYRAKGSAWTVGGNLNWIPPYAVQQSLTQNQAYNLRRVIDAYALYTVNTATKLRFTVSNLAPRDYITTSSIIDSGQRQTVVSNGPTSTNVAMRLEMRL